MASALDGIRVLDLSRVLAGPWCAMVLGDLGADVIKLESPEGDDIRHFGPPFKNGESAYFQVTNRNKKSIVVDLKTDEGRKIAVLKTASNFQYFAPITSEVIRADTPGPTQSDIEGLPWPRVPRPLYPFDVAMQHRQ